MNDLIAGKTTHPAHSPEVRAKAGATIRAKKLAQGGPVTPAERNAKRRQQRADAKLAKERDPVDLHERVKLALSITENGIRGSTRAAYGTAMNIVTDMVRDPALERSEDFRGSGRVNRGADWEEKINRWAEEIIRQWYGGTEQERAAQRKIDREAERQWREQTWKRTVEAARRALPYLLLFRKWRKLDKLAGIKAALRHGIEMAERGEPFPPEIQARGNHDLLYAAFKQGWDEARARQ
jgi:hypothetical protein